MKQIAVVLVALAGLAVLAQTAPAARQDTMKPQLVTTIHGQEARPWS